MITNDQRYALRGVQGVIGNQVFLGLKLGVVFYPARHLLLSILNHFPMFLCVGSNASSIPSYIDIVCVSCSLYLGADLEPVVLSITTCALLNFPTRNLDDL